MSSLDPSFESDETTAPRGPRRRSRHRLSAMGMSFAVVAGMVALNACRTRESQAAEAIPSAEPSAELAAANFHEETFDLVIKPVGPYSAGKPGAAEVQLTAKGGYHCNDKYPYKFKVKVEESPGLKFENPVVTKEAVHLETAQATMKVAFVPESKGEKLLAGTFSFSLCSAERCLVEKRDLAVKIPVD